MIIKNLKYKNTGGGPFTLENDEYLIQMYDYHENDCCEEHFIEWGYGLDQITEEMRFTVNTNDYCKGFIEKVEDYGIRIIPNPGTGHPIAFPGYGYNNGFYSTDLILNVVVFDKTSNTTFHKVELDISECQDISE